LPSFSRSTSCFISLQTFGRKKVSGGGRNLGAISALTDLSVRVTPHRWAKPLVQKFTKTGLDGTSGPCPSIQKPRVCCLPPSLQPSAVTLPPLQSCTLVLSLQVLDFVPRTKDSRSKLFSRVVCRLTGPRFTNLRNWWLSAMIASRPSLFSWLLAACEASLTGGGLSSSPPSPSWSQWTYCNCLQLWPEKSSSTRSHRP